MLACIDLDAMVAFFTTDVGLRIETISPADDPATIIVSRVTASRSGSCAADRDVAGHARAGGADRAEAGRTLTAPNGTPPRLRRRRADVDLPDNAPVVSIVRARADDDEVRHRSRRDGVPRPPARPLRRTVHRLAHPDPRRGRRRRLGALPPDPVPDDLLRSRLGRSRVRGPGSDRSGWRPATASCSRPRSGTGCCARRKGSR